MTDPDTERTRKTIEFGQYTIGVEYDLGEKTFLLVAERVRLANPGSEAK